MLPGAETPVSAGGCSRCESSVGTEDSKGKPLSGRSPMHGLKLSLLYTCSPVYLGPDIFQV